jgi:hypothetical protein
VYTESPLTTGHPTGENSASQMEEPKMEWHIYPHEDGSGDWIVQGINVDGEGQIYTTIFTDADAQSRAREYYEFQQSSVAKAA